MKRALLALLLVGCTQKTGIELEVRGPQSPTSIEMGVASLEFVTARASFCERWVVDQTTSGFTVDVHARDLATSPYQLLVAPSHFTDLSQPVYGLAVARDSTGRAIGYASFGDHSFEKGAVNEYAADLQFFQRSDASYVAGDGCVCIPGERWVGSGSGMGCDVDVVTSFDRLADTAGCELAPGRKELDRTVCDGQVYDVVGEKRDRAMPCFTKSSQGCAVVTRNCADHDGIAFTDECVAGDNDPLLASTALCDAYLQCEQQACGDLVGCLLQAVPPSRTISCVMKIDPNSPSSGSPQPCGGTPWRAVLPEPTNPTGAACISSVLDGAQQQHFTLGFQSADANAKGAQVRSTLCPPTLVIENADFSDPQLVPATFSFDVTIGVEVVHVQVMTVRSCENGGAPLVCHAT